MARTCVPALLLAGAGAAAAVAAEHLVHLRTESPAGRFRFDPAVVLARPGDEIRFVPDARTYGVRSIAGMQPEGTPRFSGRMGEEIVVHVDAPGVYGVKCPAYYEVGMVGLIVVGGDPPNWNAAKAVRHPPMAAANFVSLFDTAACDLGGTHAAECTGR